MNNARLLLGALACIAVAPTVHAQAFISGTQLAKVCSSKASNDESVCNAFIAGALDQVVANPELKGKLCPPTGTKLSMLREGVAKYARDKPDAAKESGVALVNGMVTASYPCSK